MEILLALLVIGSVVGSTLLIRYNLVRSYSKLTKEIAEDNTQRTASLIEVIKGKVAIDTATTDRLRVIVQNIQKTENWSKEFHRLILSEYVKYPKDRVYGFSLINTKNGQEKLNLIVSDTFEQAQSISDDILSRENQDPGSWTIKGYTSIEIPKVPVKDASEIITKANDAVPNNKPIEVYVHTLKLAVDRFATSATEKQTVGRIIKRIEKQYANS